MRAPVPAFVVLVLAVSGCVALPADPAPAAADLAAVDLGGLDWTATGCREGGGHSVHPKEFQELPEPWVPADILDDVGPQVAWSEAPGPLPPSKGNTFGNWHSTVLCDSMTFRGRALEPAFFGYVGERIERPVFDNSSGPDPDHHYLVTVVAVADDELLATLVAGGILAMKAEPSWEMLPGGLERIRMATELNGRYDSIHAYEAWGEPMVHTRLWFQNTGKELPHGADGHTPQMEATPVSLDMRTEGGVHFVAKGEGYFSHEGTQHHGPVAPPAGKTAAVVYRDFDRAWSWGPAYPEMTLRTVWDH